MVRCQRCRFLFEPATPGLLPPCRQCGGVTVPAPDLGMPTAPPRASRTARLLSLTVHGYGGEADPGQPAIRARSDG